MLVPTVSRAVAVVVVLCLVLVIIGSTHTGMGTISSSAGDAAGMLPPPSATVTDRWAPRVASAANPSRIASSAGSAKNPAAAAAGDIPLPAVALGEGRSLRQQAAARAKPSPFITPLDGEEDGAATTTTDDDDGGGGGRTRRNHGLTTSMRRARDQREGVRAWVDCGARGIHGSATAWFLRRNPKASTFHASLFDPVGLAAEYDEATRRLFRSFEYHAAAVAAGRNRTRHHQGHALDNNTAAASPFRIQVRGRRMMSPVPPGAVAEDTIATTSGGARTVPAVDLAAWLRARYTAEDFVVLKMDIEGGEWEVLAHLIDTGAIALVDELMLECHRPDPAWEIVSEGFWAAQRVKWPVAQPRVSDAEVAAEMTAGMEVAVSSCGTLFAFLSQLGTTTNLPSPRRVPFLRRVHRWA